VDTVVANAAATVALASCRKSLASCRKSIILFSGLHIRYAPLAWPEVPFALHTIISIGMIRRPRSDYNPNANSARPADIKMIWCPSTVNEIGAAEVSPPRKTRHNSRPVAESIAKRTLPMSRIRGPRLLPRAHYNQWPRFLSNMAGHAPIDPFFRTGCNIQCSHDTFFRLFVIAAIAARVESKVPAPSVWGLCEDGSPFSSRDEKRFRFWGPTPHFAS